MKILDILKKYKFTDNVQNNIKILLKKFGTKFNIKYKKHILPVEIYKDTNLKCFVLYYNIENRTYDLFPFKIEFRDPITTELNNNTYIGNIHKTENISGSEMVKIVMVINKILNVEKTYIHDGTRIKCGAFEYDLSYLKLLEKNTTFYMKFGFKFIISPYDNIKFNTNDEKHKYIIELISKCKKIEIITITKMYSKLLNLLNLIIKEQQYKYLKIQLNSANYDPSNFWYKENPSDSILDLFIETKSMLELFNNIKDKYLHKFMISLFNHKEKCIKLDLINKYLIDNQKSKIIYKNIEINYSFLNNYKQLKQIRWSMFEYIF